MKLTLKYLCSIGINLCFILLSPQSALSTNKGLLVNESQSKVAFNSKEKIYIHFDKTQYNSGENIWYKVYLVDAIYHELVTLSKVVYIDLIDSNKKIIDSKTIKVEEGSGKGDFKLPVDIIGGEYTIRAYTNFMRNFDNAYFFRKKIYVNSLKFNANPRVDTVSIKPDIHFSPEGGNMIDGFLNKIVVRAINNVGKGINVKGEIVDDTNNKILDFETSKFGLGSFQFIPRKNKKYKARVTYNGTKHEYLLQPVTEQSATIKVTETRDNYRVHVYSSLFNGVDNLELLGRQKGEIVCQAKLNGETSEVAIHVPKSDLEYGLIQFYLLNKNGTILSEELVFLNSDNLEQSIVVKPLKKAYNKEGLVEIEINFDQLLGENLSANMSMSVTEINPSKKNIYDLNIKSYLLLNSEIRDDLEPFGYYYNGDLQRKKTINELLILQDENQYLFNDTIKKDELKFSHELGFNVKGTIKRKQNKNPIKANVTVTYKNSKELAYYQTITDSLGRFSFNDLNFEERTFVTVKAKSLKSKKYSDFKIELDSVKPPQYIKDSMLVVSKIKQNKNMEFAPQEGEIKLDKVKLSTTKKTVNRFTKKRKQSLYPTPSHTLDFKRQRISSSASNPIQALQGLFPGVRVIGDRVIIRGHNSLDNNEPLFLIDGLPTDRDAILSMSMFDIDFIDIIKGPRTAIYGLRGGNGVIAVYTLDGSEGFEEQNNRNGVISFYHPGYYQARKFLQDVSNSSTLYWNPDLKLNASTVVAFNAGHKSTTYKVLLEGITSSGKPFRTEAYFDVN